MLYEQALKSFPELVSRLRSLDQDAGVRLVGRSGGREVLVFVTRFGSKYTMMTYSTKPGEGTPARRLGTREFDSPEGVGGALRKLVPGRVRAWLY